MSLWSQGRKTNKLDHVVADFLTGPRKRPTHVIEEEETVRTFDHLEESERNNSTRLDSSR